MSTLIQFVDLFVCDKDSVTAADEREGKNQTICCSSKRSAYKWQQNVHRAANFCMFCWSTNITQCDIVCLWDK